MVKPQFELGTGAGRPRRRPRPRRPPGGGAEGGARRPRDSACRSAASPPRGCPVRRATARPSSGAAARARRSRTSRARSPPPTRPGSRTADGGARRMKTAALITHSHPPAATEAVPVAAAAAKAAGWRLVADQVELDKHGESAAGVELERADETPDLCLVLGGDGTILHALRRFAGTEVPVFGVNFGTVGFLAAVERADAEDGIARALAGEVETIDLPALRVEAGGKSGIGFNDVTLVATPPRPGRRAELPDRLRRGRPRALRRPRRRDPGRLDRLQPRQPGPDPRLGREGLRGQLHRAALADRAGARRRPGRRPHRRQRARPRAGRNRPRRGRVRRARAAARSSRSASSNRPAASRSCRARASTDASATSSVTSRSEPRRCRPDPSERVRRWSASGGPSSSSPSRLSCCCST